MAEVGNLLEKITDPMIIIIRDVGLMADVSDFVRIYRISLYFRVSTYDLRWLHMKARKKPPISNSKIETLLRSTIYD